jgi:large subunit ribosomal protein L14e
MAVIEPGRICMKTAGREAGMYCIILDSAKDNFVTVTGPKSITRVKRRKTNIIHLEPTEHVLNITEDASDQDVADAWKSSGLIGQLNITVPQKKVTEKKQ